MVKIPSNQNLTVQKKPSDTPRKLGKKYASQRHIIKRESFKSIGISIQDYKNIKKKTLLETGDKFPELKQFKGRFKDNKRVLIRVNSFSSKLGFETLELNTEDLKPKSPQNRNYMKSNSISYNNNEYQNFFDIMLKECNGGNSDKEKSSQSISDDDWEFPSSPKSMHLSLYLQNLTLAPIQELSAEYILSPAPQSPYESQFIQSPLAVKKLGTLVKRTISDHIDDNDEELIKTGGPKSS